MKSRPSRGNSRLPAEKFPFRSPRERGAKRLSLWIESGSRIRFDLGCIHHHAFTRQRPGKPDDPEPTLPLNPAKEHWVGWWIKVTGLPLMYWNYMLKGYVWFPKHSTSFKGDVV